MEARGGEEEEETSSGLLPLLPSSVRFLYCLFTLYALLLLLSLSHYTRQAGEVWGK